MEPTPADTGLERLALFPLATVLFPGLVMPLHVFEPRYRQLVADLLDVPEGPGRRFGVVTVRRGSEVGDGPAEEVSRTGCVAEVRALVPHEDGRFDLAVIGRRRFTLREIDRTAGTPYLTGLVQPLPEEGGDDPARWVPPVASTFRDYLRLVSTDPDAAEALPGEPGPLSYLVSAQMVLDVPERLALLEAPDAAGRLRLALRLLRREVALVGALGALPGGDYFGRRPGAG